MSTKQLRIQSSDTSILEDAVAHMRGGGGKKQSYKIRFTEQYVWDVCVRSLFAC